MPNIVRPLMVLLLVLGLVLGASATVRDAEGADGRGATGDFSGIAGTSTYADLQGEVVLENARVRVEKFVIAPGHSTGLHRHPADQLLVFIKGGVLTSASGAQRSGETGGSSGKARARLPIPAARTPDLRP